MKRLVSGLLISSISLLPLSAMADHPPKRLLKNFMAFSALGTTGKLADFDVNVAVYGALPNGKTTTKDNKKTTTPKGLFLKLFKLVLSKNNNNKRLKKK